MFYPLFQKSLRATTKETLCLIKLKFRPIYRYDATAFATSLGVLLLVAFLLPTGSALVLAFSRGVPAALVFGAFLVFRKSDDVWS